MTKNNCLICHDQTTLEIKDLFDDRYGAKGKHSVYRCPKCGFGQTIPGIKKSDIGQFYADHYPLSTVNPKMLAKQTRLVSRLRAWFEGIDNITHHFARRGEKVLDIGSGSSISILEIGELGAEAYGVEPDPHGKAIGSKLKLRVHQGFISDDPFPKIKFDLITASQVIEHEPDPLQFLKDIHKKLAKNGRVILSFPSTNALYKFIFGKHWIHWHIPYHLNFFTKSSFNIIANQAGFKIKNIRTITPNLWTIQQIRVLLTQSKEGVVSPVWTQKKAGKGTITTKTSPNGLLRLLAALVPWVVMPINRLLDVLGLGESYLVVLEPRDQL